MNVERIVPDGPARTRVVYDYFAASTDDAEIARMVEMSNVVLDEDQAICEAVQRNLDAGRYVTGPAQPAPRGGAALVPVADRGGRRACVNAVLTPTLPAACLPRRRRLGGSSASGSGSASGSPSARTRTSRRSATGSSSTSPASR